MDYLKIKVEYETRIDGIKGTFNGQASYDKYSFQDIETIDKIIALIAKTMKQTNATVTIGDWDLDKGYNDDIDFCRITQHWNECRLIVWPGSEHKRYNDTDIIENWKPTKANIKAVLKDAITRWYNMHEAA